MFDQFGRKIEYLRVSITQRCNFKCIYCKPGSGDNCEEYGQLISPKEYGLIAKAMSKVGIKKIRITGGEPLMRPDICDIIKAVSSVPEIEDISITTNGALLGEMAAELKKSGLLRVNISLDSLKKNNFEYMTGSKGFERVLEGIEKSLKVGLLPVKINTVLVKGINDDEISDFIELTREYPIDVRFIELMPIGDFGEKNSEKIVYSSDIISVWPQLKRIHAAVDNQPAEYYSIDGYKGRIGFISPMGHKFCHLCNRVRLTCDGKLKLCLGDNSETSIIEILRESPEKLADFIKNAIYMKPEGHNFRAGFSSTRSMKSIGG